MGSLASPKSARDPLSATRRADLPTHRPTRLPRHNHRPGPATLLRHPIACLLPPKFPTSTPSARKPQASPEVSTSRFSMDASTRVREYQPVVHRLRLSASP